MCAFILYFIENAWANNAFDFNIFPAANLSNAEEVIGSILTNSINEVTNYIMMLYLARKTYVTRASAFSIIPPTFVIIYGLFNDRISTKKWYWLFGTIFDIVLVFTAYGFIFFERAKNRYKAQFQKL